MEKKEDEFFNDSIQLFLNDRTSVMCERLFFNKAALCDMVVLAGKTEFHVNRCVLRLVFFSILLVFLSNLLRATGLVLPVKNFKFNI